MRAEWVYRCLMRAYPPEFRRAFGHEMVLIFRDQKRDGYVTPDYWALLVAEIASTAPRLWAEELHDGFLLTELTMKLMSILAVLVGVLETLNSLSEARGAPFATRDGLSQVVLVITIISTVLLTLAGLAMLFRGQSARTAGLAAATGCLLAFGLMSSARPMMSIAAQLVGIAFPIALLVFLFMKRGGPRSEMA